MRNLSLVDHKKRNKRVRLLVSKLNKEHKKQAKKIDILCNDLIAAQRSFIKNLDIISFSANFYESIIGTTDLNNLLYTTTKLIRDEVPDAYVGFFLRNTDSFKLHTFESDHKVPSEQQHLENYFTSELMENICSANKLCTMDCLFAMGLQGNPTLLNKISAATVPLGQFGPSPGFILLYRPSENKLTLNELNKVTVIAPGLSQAVQSCLVQKSPTEPEA